MDESSLACLIDAALQGLDVSLKVFPLAVVLSLHIAVVAPANRRSEFVLTRNGGAEENALMF